MESVGKIFSAQCNSNRPRSNCTQLLASIAHNFEKKAFKSVFKLFVQHNSPERGKITVVSTKKGSKET